MLSACEVSRWVEVQTGRQNPTHAWTEIDAPCSEASASSTPRRGGSVLAGPRGARRALSAGAGTTWQQQRPAPRPPPGGSLLFFCCGRRVVTGPPTVMERTRSCTQRQRRLPTMWLSPSLFGLDGGRDVIVLRAAGSKVSFWVVVGNDHDACNVCRARVDRLIDRARSMRVASGLITSNKPQSTQDANWAKCATRPRGQLIIRPPTRTTTTTTTAEATTENRRRGVG